MAGHADVLLQLFLAFTAARVLGHLFTRAGLPAVVGELLAGALLGPALLGLVHSGEVLEALAEMGVILLLFMAGLETHIDELIETRKAAVRVALLGATLPFIGGLLVSIPFGYSSDAALFMATALTATSVGITARVLREMGFHQRRSVRIVLAAAVIDDILGLIVLVIVSGIALGSFHPLNLALLIVEAFAYVGFFAFFGPRLVKRLHVRLSEYRASTLFEVGVVLMLALSLLADYIGLAAIVGAFLAGLILADLRHHTEIEQRFQPLAWFFTPFFFVLMGTYIDFASFAKPPVLAAIVAFTAVAVVSKYFGGLWGATGELRGTRREVGVGMVPRGEVGIVVAGLCPGRRCDRRRHLRGHAGYGAGHDPGRAVPDQGGVRPGGPRR